MYLLLPEESSHIKYLKMNQLSAQAIKKFNGNELKSELAKRGLAVQGKKEELCNRLADAIQEGNSDKQLPIGLIKQIFKYLSRAKQKNTKNTEETRRKCYVNNQ